MAVGVLPVDVLSAEARVDPHVVLPAGAAAVADPCRLDAAEDPVELLVADTETQVMTLERFPIGEVEVRLWLTYTGEKLPCDASQGTPRRSARNFAASSRLCDGTMTWSSPISTVHLHRSSRRPYSRSPLDKSTPMGTKK